MKFKSYIGKKVLTPNGVFTFNHQEFETNDEKLSEALKNAKEVEVVVTRAKSKKKSDDHSESDETNSED